MKELLLTALEAIIVAAIPVLTTFIVKYLQAKSAQAGAQTESETAQKYLAEITSAITTAVTATSQTYVDSLKATGAFTKEAQLEALSKSKATALSLLSQSAIDFITEAYGDITAYLEAKIEETVRNTKIAVAAEATAFLEVGGTDTTVVAAATAASVAATIANTAVEQLRTEVSSQGTDLGTGTTE